MYEKIVDEDPYVNDDLPCSSYHGELGLIITYKLLSLDVSIGDLIL
jgi:hypothetical protein